MEKQFNKINLLIAILLLAVLIATPVFAKAIATDLQAKKTAASLQIIIKTADKEIDLRITSLNVLITCIGLMKKISSDMQNNLTSNAQNEINELISLKTKINADTDLQTAKTDYQSITKSYRIYLLVLPQTRIIAASDRVLTIVDSMNTVGSKLQTRISALTGTNTSIESQLLADFNAKVSDASSQANSAVNEVSGLSPDQGNQTKMQANTVALKDAKSKLKTATADLIAARKDAGTIIKNLKNNTTGTTNNGSKN
jgi:hypothetical protein